MSIYNSSPTVRHMEGVRRWEVKEGIGVALKVIG